MWEQFNRKKENEHFENEVREKQRFADEKKRERDDAEKKLNELKARAEKLTDKNEIEANETEQANALTTFEILQGVADDADADYAAKVEEKSARDAQQAYNDQLVAQQKVKDELEET